MIGHSKRNEDRHEMGYPSQTDRNGSHPPLHLEFAEETIRVWNFVVAICRLSEFDPEEGIYASFSLVAMTEDHWYRVGFTSDFERARKIAQQLERPSERTHRLSLARVTRTVSLTPDIYRLTGRTTVVGTFLRVHWAPPDSEFEIGAEYDVPLDARHPRYVTQADLDADRRRHTALYAHWHPRIVDAYRLRDEVYEPFQDDEQLEVRSPAR